MTDSLIPQKEKNNSRAVIVATTLILMTCILACTGVLIVLVFRLT